MLWKFNKVLLNDFLLWLSKVKFFGLTDEFTRCKYSIVL